MTLYRLNLDLHDGAQPMSLSIRPQFEKLQRQKQAVLSGLSDWPIERLQFRPAPASWSVLDVLDHLVKVKETCLNAVRANLPDGHPVPFRDRFGAWVVCCVIWSPLRVKVPGAAAQVLPKGAASLPLITEKWQAARDEMAQLLSGLSLEQLRYGLFRHPIGWMDIPQAIRFLSAHLQPHTYQLSRLEEKTHGL